MIVRRTKFRAPGGPRVYKDPRPHIGKCYRPTGPELLSPHNVAEILTRVVGRTVKYQEVSLKMFLKAATAQGVSPSDMASIRLYLQDLSGGTFAIGAPTTTVEDITGTPSESFETIARRYITQPDLIVPGLRAGTKLGAYAFMIKMMLTRAPDLDRWERERGHPMLKAPVLAHDSEEWREAAEEGRLLLQSPGVGSSST